MTEQTKVQRSFKLEEILNEADKGLKEANREQLMNYAKAFFGVASPIISSLGAVLLVSYVTENKEFKELAPYLATAIGMTSFIMYKNINNFIEYYLKIMKDVFSDIRDNKRKIADYQEQNKSLSYSN